MSYRFDFTIYVVQFSLVWHGCWVRSLMVRKRKYVRGLITIMRRGKCLEIRGNELQAGGKNDLRTTYFSRYYGNKLKCAIDIWRV